MVFYVPAVVQLNIKPAGVSTKAGNKQTYGKHEEEAIKQRLCYSAHMKDMSHKPFTYRTVPGGYLKQRDLSRNPSISDLPGHPVCASLRSYLFLLYNSLMPYIPAGKSKQQEKMAEHCAHQLWQHLKEGLMVLRLFPKTEKLVTGEIVMAY